MKIFETREIGGEKIGSCLGTAKSATAAWKIIYAFKDKYQNDLKVETYDRILRLESGDLAIDFGDYSRFLLIESDGTKLDLDALATVEQDTFKVAELDSVLMILNGQPKS